MLYPFPKIINSMDKRGVKTCDIYKWFKSLLFDKRKKNLGLEIFKPNLYFILHIYHTLTNPPAINWQKLPIFIFHYHIEHSKQRKKNMHIIPSSTRVRSTQHAKRHRINCTLDTLLYNYNHENFMSHKPRITTLQQPARVLWYNKEVLESRRQQMA